MAKLDTPHRPMYRTIYYSPNLALDYRIPVGALFLKNDVVSIVRPEADYNSRWLPREADTVIVDIVLTGDMSKMDGGFFGEVPESAGNNFTLEDPAVVPLRINNPEGWVLAHTFPVPYRFRDSAPNFKEVRVDQLYLRLAAEKSSGFSSGSAWDLAMQGIAVTNGIEPPRKVSDIGSYLEFSKEKESWVSMGFGDWARPFSYGEIWCLAKDVD